MSYILDALKKADRQRRPAAVPTLTTVHREPEPAPRRRLWPWMLAAVILVNAGVWIWLFRATPSIPEGSANSAGAPGRAATPVAEQLPPAAAVQPVAPAAPSSNAPALAAPSSATRSSASDLAVAPLPPRERNLTLSKPVETKPSAPARSAPKPASAEVQKPTRAEARTASPPPVTEGPAHGAPGGMPAPPPSRPATALDTPAAPAVVPTPVKPPERAASSLPTAEAPPAEVVGKLNLQVLVFSAVPAERLVFINNHKYVEGQRIDADLVLESITSEGAVLSYQGTRLMLRSDQPPSR